MLNTLYLDAARRAPSLQTRGETHDVAAQRTMRVLRAWRRHPPAAEGGGRAGDEIGSETDALQQYMRDTTSIDFTAGCRVRLVGVSATTERHSDLILSDEILFLAPEGRYASSRSNTDLPRGDVLVTNSVPNTPHILTADYIRHHAPCLLLISGGRVEWCVPNARFLYLTSFGGFSNVPCAIAGGAYVVHATVGGAQIRCVLDTGSESCVTVGTAAASRMDRCLGTGLTTSSVGVSGRASCSRLIRADVTLAGRTVEACSVAVSSFHDPSVDGFIGMGVLRCFDWLLTARAVFARPNGNPHSGASVLEAGQGARGCEAAVPLPPCATMRVRKKGGESASGAVEDR